MGCNRLVRSAAWCVAATAGVAAAAYAGYAALTWLRYGHHDEPSAEEHDALLDALLPRYDVVERHEIEIEAPAEIVMAAAREMDIAGSPLVKAIFTARRLAMGATPQERTAKGLVEETLALGWRVLAEVPGREIVIGAVTRPWQGDVTFIGLSPDAFAAFAQPDFVKIAWTLRVDPTGPRSSMFRTETRAAATDPGARSKFRRYWSLTSPGIWLIRRLSLAPLKDDAEQFARRTSHSHPTAAPTTPCRSAPGPGRAADAGISTPCSRANADIPSPRGIGSTP